MKHTWTTRNKTPVLKWSDSFWCEIEDTLVLLWQIYLMTSENDFCEQIESTMK